uniref:Uncharacterized protein n=1 Tax=Heliothis virescens TaxID=7102 RepID=A0A2A4JRT3_HELVI
MPKRKHNKDYDYISDQIKKLKKKLKRARKQSESSSSSGSEPDNNIDDCQIEAEHDINNEIDILHSETLQSPTNVEIPSDTMDNLNQTSGETLDQTLAQNPNEVITAETEEPALDKDLLDILGDDPTCTVIYGPDIHKELASRLQHITTCGLTKETRKELQQRYPLPANATLLGAPAINPEIKAALPESLANRDKAIETKQKLLASAISCIASASSQKNV